MNRPWQRLAMAAILLIAAAGATGCDAFAWILVKTIGPLMSDDLVQAEFEVKNKSILVLVDSKDPSLLSDYPWLPMDLADAIGKDLVEHEACGPVVLPADIETARRVEPKFDSWSIAEVGRYFNVDYILHVEVSEFRLKDSSGSNVYQGQAEAAVRWVSPETSEQAWPVLAAARVVRGETQPDVEAETPAEQRSVLINGFAEKIARQFYAYNPSELSIRPKVK